MICKTIKKIKITIIEINKKCLHISVSPSSWCRLEDKIGILLVLLFELYHPSIQTVSGYYQIVSHSIDQQSFFVVTHHEIVQVLCHQLWILFLAISSNYQLRNVIECLALKADLDRLELGVLWFQTKSGWEYVRGTVVWYCTKVLHLLIGWTGEG